MMWSWSRRGWLGLFFGVLVWVTSSAGGAALALSTSPDKARLREAEALKEEYGRLYGEGMYPSASEAAERACSILEEEHGNSSTELADCLNDLAVVYVAQGDYGKAEPRLERLLSIREKALGPNHPEVARALNYLAVVYGAQGDYGKAEPLQERALAIREKMLGPNHPEVARSLNDLATLYQNQGDYKRAEPLFERALAILESSLGSDHPDVLALVNNLAVLCVEQGDYGKAKTLHERALAIREKVLGPDHPEVARSLHNLAMLFKEQGEYGKAEPLQERALAILKKALGPDHPDVAYSLNNMAMFYQEQGEYGKAEPLQERALAILEKTLGSNHPDFALSLNNLASLHQDQGDYGKAEPLFERALAVREEALGPDHPDVADSLMSLASLYHDQGEYGKAEPRYERGLAIREKALGLDHPDVASSLNNMAMLYHAQGDYGRAELLYERGLAIREKVLGLDHPDVASSLNNMASLYLDQGEYGKAEPLHERGLAIRKTVLGPGHPSVAMSLNNLASLYMAQGEFGKAKPLLERALAVWEKAFGPDHPLVAYGANNLAALLSAQGEYGKAKPLFDRALTIREKVLGFDHPLVAASLDNLALLYEDQSDLERALPLRRRAFEVEEANLARTLTVASESRRLAFSSTLSGSLHHILSLHLRVAPEHDAIARLALTTLLRRKNRVQDLVSQSSMMLRRSLPQDGLRLLDDLSDVESRIAALSNRGPGPRGAEFYAQQLDELGQQYDRLWSELARHSALVETLEHHITIEDVQAALSTNGVLIEFVQYVPEHDESGVRLRRHDAKLPPRYAAYLIFPDRDFAWVDLGPAARIDMHIEAFRKALETRQAIPTEIYDAVMRPVAVKLGSTHHLVLAPAGALNLLPFGALFDGHHYLVEQYDLRYVTTGRDLLPPPMAPPVAINPVTIVVNPTGDDVPGAELEADFLASFFPETHVQRGDEATETNVRTIERPLVFHLATHGFFGQARNERDNPMFRSGLYLADVEKVNVDLDVDDGQLTAYEVSGMDLRGTQLVVLSACETGLGEVDLSEGVFGLRRAFAIGGAQTTVMSLWEVSGTSTQHLMEAYYRKLAEGMGRGEAMQAVQLEMLRTKEFHHPKDWAAFVVSGDDTPIVFPEGEGPRVEEETVKEAEGQGGCATSKGSGRGAPVGSMFIGFLGLAAIRRRA